MIVGIAISPSSNPTTMTGIQGIPAEVMCMASGSKLQRSHLFRHSLHMCNVDHQQIKSVSQTTCVPADAGSSRKNAVLCGN